MKMNPIEITDKIQNEFSNYISSQYQVDDEEYQKQIYQALQTVNLFKGPFLKTVLPFQSGKTLRELVHKGTVHPSFLKLENVYPDRPLYLHQEKAIEKAEQKRNLIITTGTGSGKTESFLYPVLNRILRMKENPSTSYGVKAILLYPMNALVNDQLERLRSILRNYPEITFGRFTGETQKKLSRAQEADQTYPINELRSRSAMRQTPPDILITNYSMLEYLMIRPEDAAIINEDSMENWQYLVIDEAHTYTGTKASEIAYLLRRLNGFSQQRPQYILTSATLGDEENIDEIIRFGRKLVSSEFEEDDVIFSSRELFKISNSSNAISPSIYPNLANNLKKPQIVYDLLKTFPGTSKEFSAEENVYIFLQQDSRVKQLYELASQTITFRKIVEKMEDVSEDELSALIHLVRFARLSSGKFLFDIKYHFFVTSPTRAFITLGKKKELRFGNHNYIGDRRAFEITRCHNCNHLYIVGSVKDKILENEDSISLYENYENSNHKLQFFSLTKEETENKNISVMEYFICPKCGKITQSRNSASQICDCHEELVPIYEIRQRDGHGKPNNLTVCPHCTSKSSKGILDSFLMNRDLATSILGNIYFNVLNSDCSTEPRKFEELPRSLFSPHRSLFQKSADSGLDSSHQDIEQILCFSDGRQQASYSAVTMGEEHDQVLGRKLIFDTIKNKSVIPIKNLASSLEARIRNGNLSETESATAAWIAILRDLLYIDGVRSPEVMGLYRFRVKDPGSNNSCEGNSLLEVCEQNRVEIKNVFCLDPAEFDCLIQFTIDKLRKEGVVDYSEVGLNLDDKEKLFPYSSQQRYLVLKKDKKEKGILKDDTENLFSFLPVGENQNNVLTKFIQKICKVNEADSKELAVDLFYFLENLGIIQNVSTNGMDKYLLDLNNFELVAGNKMKWYQCDTCKRVTSLNVKGICPASECKGHLHECDTTESFSRNYYWHQYQSNFQKGMKIKEHTAQLKNEVAREYQEQFKNKKINVLSCSTTFEMGVDIGSLENVMLRNVPPSPANYVQRAGRAGRGNEASALIVTYCLNMSHDYSYFSDPKTMIDGIVKPPVFSLVN